MTTVGSPNVAAICAQIKDVFASGPKSILDEVMVDFMRGYMRRCDFRCHANTQGAAQQHQSWLPTYSEAIAYLVERFREHMDIKNQADFEAAFLHLLKAPLPVRQLILNAVIELHISDSEA